MKLGPEVATPFTDEELHMQGNGGGDGEGLGKCAMPVPKTVGLPRGKILELDGREPDHKFAYHDAAGDLLGFVLRWEATNGRDRKQFRPVTYWRKPGAARGAWQAKAWPRPRPLYNLHKLATHPDAVILIFEGEGKVDAIERGPMADHFMWCKQPFVGVSWAGGARAVNTADFTPLAGRDVIIVPDNDVSGDIAATALVEQLQKVVPRRLRRWMPLPDLSEGWDVKDELPLPYTPQALTDSFLQAPDLPVEDETGILPGVTMDDLALRTGSPYLVDGTLPAGPSLTVIHGPPGGYKSFFAGSLLVRIAAAHDKYGRCKIKPAVCVYCTNEGVQGAEARIIAEREHHHLHGKGTPFVFISDMPNLLEDAGVETLIKTIRIRTRPFAHLGLPLVICIDTIRAAMPGGSTSEEHDLSKLIFNAKRVRDHFQAAVILIHHSPRGDPTRSSGNNTLDGCTDAMIGLVKEKPDDPNNHVAIATIARMKNGTSEGMQWRIAAIGADVGTTADPTAADGKTPVHSAYIKLLSDPAMPDKETAQATAKAKATDWSSKLRPFRQALLNVLAHDGKMIAPPDGPAVRAVPLDLVHAEFNKAYPVASTGEERKLDLNRRRNAFARAIAAARECRLVGAWEIDGASMLWLANPTEETTP
jgi:hypothetical protein